MPNSKPTLEALWQAAEFSPNRQQRLAIDYVGNPRFLLVECSLMLHRLGAIS